MLRVRPRDDFLTYAQDRLGLARPDAEDMVQELYVRIPGLVAKGEPVQDAFAYLCGCLRRLAANARAAQRRRARLLEQHAPRGVAPDRPNPEDWLISRLTSAEILGGLLGNDAELLSWRFLNERSAKEIAERLGIKEGAVWTRVHRALAEARKRWEADAL